MRQALARAISILITLLATLSLVERDAEVSAQAKRRVEHTFRNEGRGAATTLPTLVDRADLIVEGTITGDRRADYDSRPSTLYSLVLNAVLKVSSRVPPPVRVGNTIEVLRIGGVREKPDQVDVYYPEGYPLFSQGQQFLMFLRANQWDPSAPFTGVYFTEVGLGPDSVFHLLPGGRLKAAGRNRLSLDIEAGGLGAIRQNVAARVGAK
jgi:hypothetical protein